jgi:hypothetical protein
MEIASLQVPILAALIRKRNWQDFNVGCIKVSKAH